MNTIKKITILVILCILAGCSKSPPPLPPEENDFVGITMVLDGDYVFGDILGSGIATINWGDGTEETVRLFLYPS